MPLLSWSRATSIRSPWSPLISSLVLLLLATVVHCMTDDILDSLRQDTRHLFDHGYSNYMNHAFPEDELKPISCRPQVRNRRDPSDIGVNDALGNYSVTLIDSLSSLAILASDSNPDNARKSLIEFQSGVKSLIGLYGDGTKQGRCGSRACGFDLDSKVQVFETNIRGVGGLLSAHLFAAGELPIRGYEPVLVHRPDEQDPAFDWDGWIYDGQLLRLAYDLASRLLPAFDSPTGLPYPRVNLRSGASFYRPSTEPGVCRPDGSSSNTPEVTETCAAGAGSLVLEFSTLSRLTGDDRFEKLAKRAFWAVWERRSAIGLVGNGIDAQTGQWTSPPLASIGAGIDSFFEYSMKSHVLLSGLSYDPLNHETDSPESFLNAWVQAHAAVKRHIYRAASSEKHAFYGQADVHSGAPRYNWVDNLSAYYPGLLVLSGELEEAIESHLLYAALWTRYSALPERWHVFNGYIDPNFKHWAGRPEFIESTYYLYQATKDPWYLHVGEMAIRDIRRRCWTKCGWADLGDVVSGEQRDRMESFFLGETAKYAYLLFTPDHPLNKLDAPFVFSTEGHPLIVPARYRNNASTSQLREHERKTHIFKAEQCPAPLPPLPFTVSNAANRSDLFHAAALAQLHLVPVNPTRQSPLNEQSLQSPGISIADIQSPTNYTFYPWTLPYDLIPPKGMSAPISTPGLSTLTFPDLDAVLNPNNNRNVFPAGSLQKILEGVRLNSLSNVRLSMIEEPRYVLTPSHDGTLIEMDAGDAYRIHSISNWALGRDEKVFVGEEVLRGVSPADPHFSLVKDLEMIDLVIDVTAEQPETPQEKTINDVLGIDIPGVDGVDGVFDGLWGDLEDMLTNLLRGSEPTGSFSDPVGLAKSLALRASSKISLSTPSLGSASPIPQFFRHSLPAILPVGPGAVPIDSGNSDTVQSQNPANLPLGQLPHKSIFYLDDELCSQPLPRAVVNSHNILVIPRGGCSFSEKLANIPSFVPTKDGLKLVVILSLPETRHDFRPKGSEHQIPPEAGTLIRPLLDDVQRTPSGLERRHGLRMCMVDGTAEAVDLFRRAATGTGHWEGAADHDGNKKFIQSAANSAKQARIGSGLGIKRRYWFESLGKVIGNLILV
ncbi:glycoside hydrolase family 47 protein [Acrodontium crateriforme]|uniref:alpha-1,2-Mannosidase n=1 Tax=Acrodontium crateriforme TaxID=150365 RepID=A0AAQ3M7E3_9PEZI|nr:glycoside hydrolase family 47 protein [Acrodontium crateriforme]